VLIKNVKIKRIIKFKLFGKEFIIKIPIRSNKNTNEWIIKNGKK